MLVPIDEVILGIYVGVLAGLFPAFVAFLFGFGFKYFTDVSVPGLGVVVLCGAIAGISGGLMGIMDPTVAESWTGITAIVVILMACLWGHGMGDRLGERTPRRFTLERLRESKLTADLVDRVDNYGQLEIRPVGDISDIEGYPPLPSEMHQRIRQRSWRFPADLSLAELEERVERELLKEFELAEAEVSVDRRGRARIAAGPVAGALSRRVPEGHQAVSIHTLLPTGLARQDEASVHLPDENVRGTVLSARSTEAASEAEPTRVEPDDEAEDLTPAGAPRAPTTTGGEGRVTLAVQGDDVEPVLRYDFAPMTVHARGTQREYEAIAILNRQGNQFQKLRLEEGSDAVAATLSELGVREAYNVQVLSIRRDAEHLIGPKGDETLRAGDELIVVGPRGGIQRFEEAVV